MYHAGLAYIAAVIYGFPSRSMKVIGVTGTKGKSTTVYLITRILEANGHAVAAIGSLGYKIREKEWPNTLKMSMPGRFKLQKFLAEAKKAGCEYVVLEVTSEGIKQKRHLGIEFDCAVFTNLHREHIESHGSFENYMAAKQELFQCTKKAHVINADDVYSSQFGEFPAQKKIFYGFTAGDIVASNVSVTADWSSFEVYKVPFNILLGGKFNVLNCLAALSVGAVYGIDLPSMKPALEAVEVVPGRMDFVQKEPFQVVVDYAHTPDSLEAVYKALKPQAGRLICVLGSAGGGRDVWKRPEFGKIADQYCDVIYLTNEDPYEENEEVILDQVEKGITHPEKIKRVLDRKQAITQAIKEAQPGDVVVITGKGSETSMALANGKKIPWSDRDIAHGALN